MNDSESSSDDLTPPGSNPGPHSDPEPARERSVQPDGAVSASETAAVGAARLASTWTLTYAAVVIVSSLLFLGSILGLVPLSPEIALVMYAVLGMAAVVSWAALTSWMMRLRMLRQSRGEAAPDVWKIWAGWLIPVYAWFGPFQAMRALTEDVEGIGPIRARWWGSWLICGFLWFQAFLLGTFGLAVIGLAGASISMFFSARALRQVIARTMESLTTPS